MSPADAGAARGSPAALDENYHNHPESKEVIERYLEVMAPGGVVLARNERLGSRPLDGAVLVRERVSGKSERVAMIPLVADEGSAPCPIGKNIHGAWL